MIDASRLSQSLATALKDRPHGIPVQPNRSLPLRPAPPLPIRKSVEKLEKRNNSSNLNSNSNSIAVKELLKNKNESSNDDEREIVVRESRDTISNDSIEGIININDYLKVKNNNENNHSLDDDESLVNKKSSESSRCETIGNDDGKKADKRRSDCEATKRKIDEIDNGGEGRRGHVETRKRKSTVSGEEEERGGDDVLFGGEKESEIKKSDKLTREMQIVKNDSEKTKSYSVMRGFPIIFRYRVSGSDNNLSTGDKPTETNEETNELEKRRLRRKRRKRRRERERNSDDKFESSSSKDHRLPDCPLAVPIEIAHAINQIDLNNSNKNVKTNGCDGDDVTKSKTFDDNELAKFIDKSDPMKLKKFAGRIEIPKTIEEIGISPTLPSMPVLEDCQTNPFRGLLTPPEEEINSGEDRLNRLIDKSILKFSEDKLLEREEREETKEDSNFNSESEVVIYDCRSVVPGILSGDNERGNIPDDSPSEMATFVSLPSSVQPALDEPRKSEELKSIGALNKLIEIGGDKIREDRNYDDSKEETEEEEEEEEEERDTDTTNVGNIKRIKPTEMIVRCRKKRLNEKLKKLYEEEANLRNELLDKTNNVADSYKATMLKQRLNCTIKRIENTQKYLDNLVNKEKSRMKLLQFSRIQVRKDLVDRRVLQYPKSELANSNSRSPLIGMDENIIENKENDDEPTIVITISESHDSSSPSSSSSSLSSGEEIMEINLNTDSKPAEETIRENEAYSSSSAVLRSGIDIKFNAIENDFEIEKIYEAEIGENIKLLSSPPPPPRNNTTFSSSLAEEEIPVTNTIDRRSVISNLSQAEQFDMSNSSAREETTRDDDNILEDFLTARNGPLKSPPLHPPAPPAAPAPPLQKGMNNPSIESPIIFPRNVSANVDDDNRHRHNSPRMKNNPIACSCVRCSEIDTISKSENNNSISINNNYIPTTVNDRREIDGVTTQLRGKVVGENSNVDSPVSNYPSDRIDYRITGGGSISGQFSRDNGGANTNLSSPLQGHSALNLTFPPPPLYSANLTAQGYPPAAAAPEISQNHHHHQTIQWQQTTHNPGSTSLSSSTVRLTNGQDSRLRSPILAAHLSTPQIQNPLQQKETTLINHHHHQQQQQQQNIVPRIMTEQFPTFGNWAAAAVATELIKDSINGKSNIRIGDPNNKRRRRRPTPTTTATVNKTIGYCISSGSSEPYRMAAAANNAADVTPVHPSLRENIPQQTTWRSLEKPAQENPEQHRNIVVPGLLAPRNNPNLYSREYQIINAQNNHHEHHHFLYQNNVYNVKPGYIEPGIYMPYIIQTSSSPGGQINHQINSGVHQTVHNSGRINGRSNVSGAEYSSIIGQQNSWQYHHQQQAALQTSLPRTWLNNNANANANANANNNGNPIGMMPPPQQYLQQSHHQRQSLPPPPPLVPPPAQTYPQIQPQPQTAVSNDYKRRANPVVNVPINKLNKQQQQQQQQQRQQQQQHQLENLSYYHQQTNNNPMTLLRRSSGNNLVNNMQLLDMRLQSSIRNLSTAYNNIVSQDGLGSGKESAGINRSSSNANNNNNNNNNNSNINNNNNNNNNISPIVYSNQGITSSSSSSGLKCLKCGISYPKFNCADCESAFYCNEYCQRDHWAVHSLECRKKMPKLKKLH